ncbi:unnamed protein product [Owenia fusiformis]|uniref:Uncharacterized protein n=1 Tax=Owenia fusiformis TaxID=6347 RepID=A0A8J1UVG1_OWEFU|nr:unnamed protein product [Owenia fusiformis]
MRNASNSSVTMTQEAIQNEKGVLYGLLVVLCSGLCFQVLNKLLDCGGIPKSAEGQKWRWKNILISFIHACISGSWSLYSFYDNPKMLEDLMWTHNNVSYTLISMTVGYTIYDCIDMLIYQRGRQTYELLVHHAVIIICFGIAIMSYIYVGYACLALMVELNSAFLHLRQLLQILGFKKDNSTYRLNSLVNLGTYIVFRIATLAWMTRWLVINKDLIPFVVYTCGSIGLAVMTIMNIVLFYRLLRSDFFVKQRPRNIKECDPLLKQQ